MPLHVQNPSLSHPRSHVTRIALHSVVLKNSVHLTLWFGKIVAVLLPLQQQYTVGPRFSHTPFLLQGNRRKPTEHSVDALPNRGVVVVVDVVEVVEVVVDVVVVGHFFGLHGQHSSELELDLHRR